MKESSVYARDHHSARRREDNADRDLWFKAAVIAVPIAGGFILVLLVLLAVRMLRSDSNRHRRLIQMRRERSLTKAHMYISEHFMGRNSSSATGLASKLQHCSLFDEKLHPPRGSYSVCSDKPPSSVCSAHGGGSAGTGFWDNSKMLTNSSDITHSSSTGGNSSNKAGFTSSTVCCTDDSPCCGGMCSFQRDTQLSQCETCNKNCKRFSRDKNFNSGRNSSSYSNGKHVGLSSDIKPASISGSKGGSGKICGTQSTAYTSSFSATPSLSSSSNTHHKPCAFFYDPSPSAGNGCASTHSQGKGDKTTQTIVSNTCDLEAGISHSQLQQQQQQQHHHHHPSSLSNQHQTNQQQFTIVAHWEKTNPRRPTAVV
ncbi:Bmp and activin membrane-bound inhibitor-like protein [Plakobranchus ocellatus]|uniref:Bmp and activin membrane-bound inhibitor-like protein n=1 Tax=Plakobranchus ocellatus TaxID=259542 RepID=A0AAV4D1E8_9GAST|nr:Bmp and activin membrane-bound inhibitor-like protein [Plakobranchus ocellatus]